MAKRMKHLPGEHGQQKEKQNRYFEIVGLRLTDFRKIIEAADQQDRAANHPGDLEIRERRAIEHSVKFPERDQSEHADQKPEQAFMSRKRNRQGDRPKHDGAGESKN